MATRKYLTNDALPRVALQGENSRELIIEIQPRMCVRWEGTAAQLTDEGLIPQNFEWPYGRGRKCWEAGDFTFWLERCRPSGTKGPMSVWVHGDWWFLRRSLTADGGRGIAPARLYEARRAYECELWSQTPVARVQWMRWRMAREHEEFQTFLRTAIGEVGCTRRSRSN